MMITQLTIGTTVWMLGCWHFPERLLLGAKTRAVMSILIFTAINVAVIHQVSPLKGFIGDVVSHKQAILPNTEFFTT